MKLYRHEVPETPNPQEELVCDVMFNENGDAVVMRGGRVACCVAVVFDGVSWYANVIKKKNVRVFVVKE